MLRFVVALTASLVAFWGCTRGEPTIFAVAVHPANSQIIYVSSSKHPVKTRDGGATWTPISEGLEHSQVLAFAIDPAGPSTIYAGTFANAIYKSSDGGQRWRPANVGMKEHVSVVNALAIHPRDSQQVYAGTTVGVFRSTDGGASWVETVAGMESVYVVAVAIDPRSPDVMFAGTSGGMYRSEDGGARWTIINEGLIKGQVGTAMSLGVNAISVNPDDPLQLVIATGKGLFVSANRGATWQPRAAGSGTSFMTALQRDPADPSRLYAGGDQGVFVSTDGGNTWTAVSSDPKPGIVRSLAVDPSSSGVVYAGTQRGLFKSIDGGATWSHISLAR
jgi:photosystem II stability/assembly factor-like uncharacterized protein